MAKRRRDKNRIWRQRLLQGRDVVACHWCGRGWPVKKLWIISQDWQREYLDCKATLDHVIPLSKGGPDKPENLVWACPHCNNARNMTEQKAREFKQKQLRRAANAARWM